MQQLLNRFIGRCTFSVDLHSCFPIVRTKFRFFLVFRSDFSLATNSKVNSFEGIETWWTGALQFFKHEADRGALLFLLDGMLINLVSRVYSTFKMAVHTRPPS